MKIVPISDLKNTAEIEKKCVESGESIYITKNGYGRLVIMDIDVYEKKLRTMYEAIMVNKALYDLNDGENLTDGKEFMTKIMEKYEI